MNYGVDTYVVAIHLAIKILCMHIMLLLYAYLMGKCTIIHTCFLCLIDHLYVDLLYDVTDNHSEKNVFNSEMLL